MQGFGQDSGLVDNGMDLFGTDDGRGDDGGLGLHGELDKSPPPKSLEAIAVFKMLADPLDPFGKDDHKIAIFQKALGIFLRGPDATDAAHKGSHEGEVIDKVFDQKADITSLRV